MADGQRIKNEAAGSIETTDDTPAIVATMNIPAGHTGTVHINVVGQVKSAAAQRASVFAIISVRNQGGSISFSTLVSDEGDPPPEMYWKYQVDPGAIEITASGNDLMIQFTGPPATNTIVAGWITAYLVEVAVSES